MITVRLAMLLLASLPMLAAFGAVAPDMQPSALRVLVTATIALLAPLFWPGSAGTPARSALRVLAWSAAVTGLAAAGLRILGDAAQPLSTIAAACVMLMLILLVAHAAATAVEERWRARPGDAQDARERAGRTIATVLALLGSLPLWFGPFAQFLGDRHDWLVDAVVGASPLTHLAIASGNDLLRNQWFYQHSNLAALPVSYPGPVAVVAAYAGVLSALALGTLVRCRARRRAGEALTHPPSTETPP